MLESSIFAVRCVCSCSCKIFAILPHPTTSGPASMQHRCTWHIKQTTFFISLHHWRCYIKENSHLFPAAAGIKWHNWKFTRNLWNFNSIQFTKIIKFSSSSSFIDIYDYYSRFFFSIHSKTFWQQIFLQIFSIEQVFITTFLVSKWILILKCKLKKLSIHRHKISINDRVLLRNANEFC